MSAHVVESVSAYLDGELAPAERQAVEAHLRGCDECARLLADFAAVDTLARELPLEAPAGYFEALPARVRFKVTPRRRASPRLPAWSWAVAAALVVAVVTPILLRQNPRPAELARRVTPPAPQAVERADPAAARATAEPKVAAEALQTPAAGLGADREQAPSASSRDERRARANEGLLRQKEAQDSPAAAPAAPPPPAPAGGGFSGALAKSEQPEALGKAREATAKDKQLQEALPAQPGRTASAPAANAAFAAPPEQGAAGQHLYEPKAEGDLADVAAPSTEEAKKTAPAAKSDLAAQDALKRAASPAPRLRFRDLLAEVADSVEDARRLREQWRAFGAQGAPFRQADEARVRIVEVGIQAFRLSNDPADLLLARRDAEAYLRRDDAAQGDRVRSLLATLGN